MSQLLVSIIIPTYNRAAIISKTLNSVIAQTYPNWECLVIDDGSTDTTDEVINSYCLKDTRVSYYKRPETKLKGANACRNFGLENGQGNYVVFFDSDDYMYPEFLEKQVESLNKSKANYSICNSEWVTREGKILKGFHGGNLESNDRINDYISFKTFWPIHSVMYVSEFLMNNNLRFNEKLQQSQEYDFHVKAMQKDINYTILNKTLVRVIAGEDSISYSTKNAFAKSYSSLCVRYSFLKNKPLNLTYETSIFLLHDIHRIFMQQITAKNRKASFYAAYYYIKGHFCRKDIFNNYFFKHVIPVLTVCFTYSLFNKGYVLLKKSNTFNYNK